MEQWTPDGITADATRWSTRAAWALPWRHPLRSSCARDSLFYIVNISSRPASPHLSSSPSWGSTATGGVWGEGEPRDHDPAGAGRLSAEGGRDHASHARLHTHPWYDILALLLHLFSEENSNYAHLLDITRHALRKHACMHKICTTQSLIS